MLHGRRQINSRDCEDEFGEYANKYVIKYVNGCCNSLTQVVLILSFHCLFCVLHSKVLLLLPLLLFTLVTNYRICVGIER
jgi:hypothetical protein